MNCRDKRDGRLGAGLAQRLAICLFCAEALGGCGPLVAGYVNKEHDDPWSAASREAELQCRKDINKSGASVTPSNVQTCMEENGWRYVERRQQGRAWFGFGGYMGSPF